MYDKILMYSGGLDSTAILLKELHKGNKILCILYNYGQEHIVEVEYAKDILKNLNVPYEEVLLPSLHREGDIFYGRNLIFLSYAFALADKEKVGTVLSGFCGGDQEGFPDCRKSFIKDAQSLLNSYYLSDIKIETPLLLTSKADTFKMLSDLEALEYAVHNTLTCYRADTTLHAWGRGCGDCNSCKARAEGYNQYKEENYYV